MNKVTITASTLTDVVTSSTVDTFVAITAGDGVLCFGDKTGVTLDECVPVGAGYQVVVPAGVDVSVAQTGGTVTLVTGPFGV